MDHSQFKTDLPDLIHRYLADALDQVEPQADHTKVLVGWEKRAGLEIHQTGKPTDILEQDFQHRLKGLNRS